MEDRYILELFNNRDERAISESQKKYGDGCKAITIRILNSREDSEEVVNDTFLKVWNTIPPEKPQKLSSYIFMICRNLSIDCLRRKSSLKRGGSEYELSIEELGNCIPDSLADSEIDENLLKDALNDFLSKLPEKKRIIFMRRYWWFYSVSEIANDLNMSDGNVKMSLHRTRKKLKEYLEKEGFDI